MFQRKKGVLYDYLYVDTNRLESYVSQIKNPTIQQRTPTWNVSLSLIGPSLGAGLQTSTRQLGTHEMVKTLLDHLRKNEQLDTRRESVMFKDDVLFCLETCVARKVIFPSDLTKDLPGIKELAIWISMEPEQLHAQTDKPELSSTRQQIAGPLFLIESHLESDDPYMNAWSGYSAYNYLM